MSDITAFPKFNPKHYPTHPGAEHPPTMCMEIPVEEYENNFFVLSPSEFKAQYNIIQQYPKITRL